MSVETTHATDLEQVVMESAALSDPPVPGRILVVPWGDVKSTAGSFVVDEQSAAATIAAFREHGTDLPIDYEHQTLGGAYSSPTGLAPAAGWVKKLVIVSPEEAAQANTAPGLWAEVEWTADAAEKLAARHYRYLSPVALIRREDRRVVALHSIALTNKPAIVGMKPVINRVPSASEDPSVELRRLLSLDESATEDLVLVAAAQRIRSLQRGETLRDAAARVERAMSAGKLTAAQREWALTLAERDPAEFDRWESAAPLIVPLGRLTGPSTVPTGDARRRAIEQSARAEWRANKSILERLCTEEAFVHAAVRDSAA